MYKSLRYRNWKKYPGRKLAISLHVVLLAVSSVGIIPRHQALAQAKPAAGQSPLCTRGNALEMIKQQVALTKTFNHPERRITVLLRAADLLWPYEQRKARVVFSEAFDLATEIEKEKNEQKLPRSALLRLQIPDQRYVVIRAVAKRDAAWAKELTRQMLKSAHDSKASSTRNSIENVVVANRLLDSAHKLIATDINAAFDLARVSLNYPASFGLNRFLYRLAEVNQQAADQFYAQSLVVYADKPMREFLYLQAYPFAWRETLNTPIVPNYEVPANFVTNQSLQRRFMQVMLRRAQQALEEPLDEVDTYRSSNVALRPATVHLFEGLIRLEPQVSASLPDLLAPLVQAREKLLVSLSVETQRLLLQPGREISTTPDQTFDERVESARKAPDVNERDDLIANAVLSEASKKESLASVVQAIDTISDSNLRAHFLEWVYFHRAINAVQDKQFEEAAQLASRVDGPQQRAFLHTEIAKGLLNKSETQTHGREVLDEAINEAKKAGGTLFAARTLLTASNLYAKIDLGRSISLLADAINCINRIEAPDFSSDDQSLENTPERRVRGGQYGGEYSLRFYMPGPGPERAFLEMAKIDFDTALSQSSALSDKFQRALSMLALAGVCLEQPEQPKRAGLT